jgi:enamine deaminase RidA (YjgF/YER057c/UK114 family)
MIERINPDGAPKPASNYAQGVVHSASAKRLVVSGQIGVTVDGSIVPGMEGQLRQAWANLFAVMAGGNFEKKHLIRTTIYVTSAGQVALSRKVRDEVMDGVLAASTYIQVAGLASPDFLCEIEGEAVMD